MKERTEEKGDGCLFWIIGVIILMGIIGENGENKDKINKLEARIETLEKMHLEDGHK